MYYIYLLALFARLAHVESRSRSVRRLDGLLHLQEAPVDSRGRLSPPGVLGCFALSFPLRILGLQLGKSLGSPVLVQQHQSAFLHLSLVRLFFRRDAF